MSSAAPPPVCRQCGWAVPARRRATRAGEDPEVERFCCLGCELAWHVRGGAPGHEGRADRLLARILVSAFLAMGVMVFSLAGYGALLEGGDGGERASAAAAALAGLQRLAALLLTLPIVHLLGVPLAVAVARGRRWLSADGLIVIGSGAALASSLWATASGRGHAYYETVAMVLVLVGLGRWLDARAKERARSHLASVAEAAVPPARVLDAGGEREVDPGTLRPGDRVRVRPGEPVPVDGLVVAGRAFVDASWLTGESEARSVSVGERILAGALPVDGYLDVEAWAVAGGRVRDDIERILAEALAGRAGQVRLADRLVGALVPLVAVAALATFVFHALAGSYERALMNALAFVLISCPCALGIATPLAFWTALSEAWGRGILVRGAEVLERLARARRFDFDKTGTLTRPRLELVSTQTCGSRGEGEVLALAAALEAGSEHPVGAALRRAHLSRASSAPVAPADDFAVLPGRGVTGRVGELELELVAGGGEPSSPFTVVELREVRSPAAPLARFRLAAELDPEARGALAALRLGGAELRVLTGDSEGPARWVAAELGVPVEFGLSPADKVERVRSSAGAGAGVYVGDGLNDVAALAAAGTGIAVAGASPRSVEVADVTLLGGGIGALPDLVRLSRRAVSTARGNLLWSFAYNVVGWSLAASGRLTPVFAALAMVLSSAVVVLRSNRSVVPRRSATRPAAKGIRGRAGITGSASAPLRGAAHGAAESP